MLFQDPFCCVLDLCSQEAVKLEKNAACAVLYCRMHAVLYCTYYSITAVQYFINLTRAVV